MSVLMLSCVWQRCLPSCPCMRSLDGCFGCTDGVLCTNRHGAILRQEREEQRACLRWFGRRGYGVVARRRLPMRSCVLEYTGEVRPWRWGIVDTAPRRSSCIVRSNPESSATAPWGSPTSTSARSGRTNIEDDDDNWYDTLSHRHMHHTQEIDATRFGSLARFVNHSCEPNCEVYQVYVDGLPALILYCRQAIEQVPPAHPHNLSDFAALSHGVELTWNYRGDQGKGKFGPPIYDIPCLCGAAKCNGVL